MRHVAVFLLAALATGGSGSPATAQSRAFEAQESQTKESPVGAAVADPARSRPLTEEEFLKPLFRADSPWARSFTEDLGARGADLALARVFDQPELAVARENLGNGGTETEARVSWRFPRRDRRRLDIERASAELTAAEASFDRSVLDFKLNLRRVYADWSITVRKVDILEAESTLLSGLVRRSEERARVGESSGLDVRRIRLAATAARARAGAARAELATVRGEIVTWRPDLSSALTSTHPVLPELLPAPTSEPPVPPAVAALTAELRASDLAAELAGKVTDSPAITLGWRRVEPDSIGPAFDGPILGLSWPIPLSGRKAAERLRAEGRRESLQARLDLSRGRFKAELRGAEASYAELRRAAADAEAALADADPTLRAAGAAFRLGEGDLTPLLDAIRTVTEARLAVLELLSQALERQRRLERVRGQLFTHSDLDTEFRRISS